MRRLLKRARAVPAGEAYGTEPFERVALRHGDRNRGLRRRVKITALALTIFISSGFAAAYFVHRAGADFDQTGDTNHLDYQGYANWSFALGGGTLANRTRDARPIVDEAVPDCRRLTAQLRNVADSYAKAVERQHDPGEEAGAPPSGIVIPAYYKCGRTAVVAAINAGRDLRDYGVTEALLDSLGKFNT